MNLKHIITGVLADRVAQTPWAQRYKGTILIVLTGVVAALSAIAPLVTDAPGWVAPVIATIVTVGTALVNRFTRDGFTPSMVARATAGVSDFAAIGQPATPYDAARHELAQSS